MSGKKYWRFMMLVVVGLCCLSASEVFAETIETCEVPELAKGGDANKKGKSFDAKVKALANSTEIDEAKKIEAFLESRQAYRQAASLYQRAFKLCPKFPNIMFGVGLMYERARDYDESNKWYEAFLKSTKPKHQTVRDQRKKAKESIKAFETQKVQVSFQCKTPDVMLSINGQSEKACPFKFQTMPGLLVAKASWGFDVRKAKSHIITDEKVQTITIAPFGEKAVKTVSKVTPVSKTVTVQPTVSKKEDVTLSTESTAGSKHPLFWAGMTGVVVGLGVGGYGLWLGGDVQDKVEQRRLTQAEASYRTNVANGLLIGGLVTTGLGLGAVYYGWKLSPKRQPVTVGATVFGDGAMVTIDAKF